MQVFETPRSSPLYSDLLLTFYFKKELFFLTDEYGLAENVTEQSQGGEQYTITKRTPPFALGVLPHPVLDSPFPLPGKRRLSMPETGEKERNYLFKSYTDLE